MEITYLDSLCFRIKTKNALTLTDAHTIKDEKKASRETTDIITLSHDRANLGNAAKVQGTGAHPEPFVISGPGEYEVSQVFITSFFSSDSQKNDVIYLISAEGIDICHPGLLNHELTDKQVEWLSATDILFIPFNGNKVLNPDQAVKLVNQLEPEIIIPMQYELSGEVPASESFEKFQDKLGIKAGESLKKLTIKSDFLPEQKELVVLARS